jgi:hypothetical protein
MSYLIRLLAVSFVGGGSVAAIHEVNDPTPAVIVAAVVVGAFVVACVRGLSDGGHGHNQR